MSNKKDIQEMLVSMGFQPNYIGRAFKEYEKNYGHSYNVEVITEIIVRLQNKDEAKQKSKDKEKDNNNNKKQTSSKSSKSPFKTHDIVIFQGQEAEIRRIRNQNQIEITYPVSSYILQRQTKIVPPQSLQKKGSKHSGYGPNVPPRKKQPPSYHHQHHNNNNNNNDNNKNAAPQRHQYSSSHSTYSHQNNNNKAKPEPLQVPPPSETTESIKPILSNSLSQNEALNEQIEQLSNENKRFKQVVERQQVRIRTVQASNEALQNERNAMQSQLDKVQNEKNRLQVDIDRLMDEQKELMIKNQTLEEEVKRLKVKCIDTDRFREWSDDEIVNWIISINNGRFSKYEEKLRETLSEEQMIGEYLSEINELNLKSWGIVNFRDRKDLIKEIQALTTSKNSKIQQEMEGNNDAPTAYL